MRRDNAGPLGTSSVVRRNDGATRIGQQLQVSLSAGRAAIWRTAENMTRTDRVRKSPRATQVPIPPYFMTLSTRRKDCKQAPLTGQARIARFHGGLFHNARVPAIVSASAGWLLGHLLAGWRGACAAIERARRRLDHRNPAASRMARGAKALVRLRLRRAGPVLGVRRTLRSTGSSSAWLCWSTGRRGSARGGWSS